MLCPVWAVITVLIKKDGGPVIYKARRVGLNGKPFIMWKFRTMVVNADQLGGSSTPDDDARITDIGRFLRRTKLDEFPQLVNVLKGEMSFVGPRPQIQWAVDLYTLEERQVLSVRPGMTDSASVRFPSEGKILKGSKDPDGDYMKLIHPHKMRLSLEYVLNRSMLLDLKLIFQTVWTILK